MKYQTLTSTLVLTFLLAGSTAQAMDLPDEPDNIGGSTPAVIQPLGDATKLDGANTATPNAVPAPITEADWLTYSQINPNNFKLLTQVVSAGTDEDKEAALAALKKDIEAQKYAKNTQEATEQETVLARLYGWLTAPFQQTPLPPQPEVLSTMVAVEIPSEESLASTTVVKVETKVQDTETSKEPAPSFFTNLNPWNWLGGSTPKTDSVDNAVAKFIPLVPVGASAGKLQNEEETEIQ